MQSYYASSFDREMSCTEADWLSWLPGAVRENALTIGVMEATVVVGSGRLLLRWQVLAPLQIALVRLPLLGVKFRFDSVEEAPRQRFMRSFDLYMQRGGG